MQKSDSLSNPHQQQTNLPPEARQSLSKAIEAAYRQQWEEAVRWFREARHKAGTQVPDDLRKGLAACLANDAVSKINQAAADYEKIVLAHEQQVDFFLMRNTENGCAHCGAPDPLPGIYEPCGCGNPWPVVNHPAHGQVRLCFECALQIQSLLNQRPKPGQATIDVLRASAKELYEAV